MKKIKRISIALVLTACISLLSTACNWMWLNDPYPELEEMVYHEEGYYLFRGEKYWSRTMLLGYEDIVEIRLLGPIITIGKKKDIPGTWLTIGKSERDIAGNIIVGGGVFIKDGFDYFKKENLQFDALCQWVQEETAFKEVYIFKETVLNNDLLEKTDIMLSSTDYKQYWVESIALRISEFDYVACEADVYMIDDVVYLCNYLTADYMLYKVSDEYQEVFRNAINQLNSTQTQ